MIFIATVATPTTSPPFRSATPGFPPPPPTLHASHSLFVVASVEPANEPPLSVRVLILLHNPPRCQHLFGRRDRLFVYSSFYRLWPSVFRHTSHVPFFFFASSPFPPAPVLLAGHVSEQRTDPVSLVGRPRLSCRPQFYTYCTVYSTEPNRPGLHLCRARGIRAGIRSFCLVPSLIRVLQLSRLFFKSLSRTFISLLAAEPRDTANRA